jgi:hypothetical protein
MRARVRVVFCCAALCSTFASVGCVHPRSPVVVTDPDPSVKIPAYKQAVRKKDRAAVRQLVTDLDSDDPAVRLYAIGALERLTGEQLGYRYFDSDEARRPAVERWHQWLRDGETAGHRP